ncbi:MAG: type restriction enzyme subunit [Methanobacteriaceae archaeon]|nr:type restriction enzyme subunit [Methanobacteriaceae archaeon]
MKFKDSPLGKIPMDWDVVKLEDVVKFLKGKKPKKLSEEPFEGALPYLTAECLRSQGKKTKFADCKDCVLVNDGEILLLWDGSNAGEFFKGFEGVLASTMVKLVFDEEHILPNFLFYLLKTKENFLRAQTIGTGIPHVNKSVINALKLPLPPLEEQKEIAKILQDFDNTIQKTNKTIKATEKLKKGLIQKLLTKGILHRELKDSPVGKIPENWEIVRLGDVAEVRKNKNLGSFEEVAFISMENVHISSMFADYEIRNKSECKSFVYCEPGDLLLAKITPSFENGKQGFVPPNVPGSFALATTEVYPLVCTNIHPHFLFYILKYYKFRKKLEFSMRGSTGRQRVPKDALIKLKIPLPSLKEQKEIAKILQDIDRKLELLKERKAKLENIKKGLMHELLTGERRVKVEGSS